jgi:hypothetical protein
MMTDDAEVEEKLAPSMVALAGSNENDGNIMPEVVHSPQEYPVLSGIGDVEVLAVKGKGGGELGAVGEGELVVIGEPRKFFFTDSPGFHWGEGVFSP